jgi:tetratricopeptide (TPR) repeat protein
VLLGDLYERDGDHARALVYYRNALSIWEPLVATARNDVDTRLRVASTEDRIGEALAKTGSVAEATVHLHKALASAEGLAAATPPNEWALYVVADSLSGLGDVFATSARNQRHSSVRIKELNEAHSWCQRSADAWRQVHNPGAMNPGSFDCGKCESALANIRVVGP